MKLSTEVVGLFTKTLIQRVLIALFCDSLRQDKLDEQTKQILRPATSREDLSESFSSGGNISWSV